ncbi:hypothetical protein ZIOFF_068847 [Zingiber officinale]|uniref:Uncharacterized protein n=1 Tax=Zingiber officinale TaxID=94328 RepID=A0A8J5BFY0_ZINOF|nr:hypothetical protein ZIOFF_068847 [Zingiber officinale]
MPPDPWKRFGAGGSGSEVSRLLASLRPPEQRGSLVVQTGFPTSLADLVVKNRGSVVSSSDAASAAPFNVSPRPGPFDPPAPEADSSSLSSLGPSVTAIREIEFLLVVIVVLLALATERRKLVVAIMLSAIVLRLFDWNGLRLIRFSSQRSGAKRNLDSPVKDWGLEGRGMVSHIMEVTTDSSSERGSVDLIQGREISLESVSNVAFDEVSGNEKQCIKLAKQDRHETKFRNSQVLVFWGVALLGLLGGKTSAIVLTASWYLLSRPIEFLRKKGMNLFVVGQMHLFVSTYYLVA